MSDYSEIVVLLDRSGSMQSAKDDHEGGLRSFVEDQKQLEGDVRFTLVQFDSQGPCEIVYDGVPIAEVGEIKLTPRGGTPLLDAIGLATSHVEKRLDGKKPDQVIVMVITDGEENSSREWTRERIKGRIEELEKREWKFLYLGANVDAFSEAGGLGIARTSAMNFNAASPRAIAATYANTSSKLRASRQYAHANKVGGQYLTGVDYDNMKAFFNYTDEDRAASAANPGGPAKESDQWKSSS